jgi:hypothetical protein
MVGGNPIPGRGATVSLREMDIENLFEILDLKVKPEQESLVAPNAVSIAEAHFWPTGWFRAIYADDTPVGFVMVDDHYLADDDRRLELEKKRLRRLPPVASNDRRRAPGEGLWVSRDGTRSRTREVSPKRDRDRYGPR